MPDRQHLRMVEIASIAGGEEDDDDLAAAARAAAGDVDASLDLARRIGPATPLPGRGRTGERWKLLATLAVEDLTVARVVEPHLDALAILAEAARGGLAAPIAGPQQTFGVFASEGPQSSVALDADGRLDGVKPWCSLAGRLTDALVTAATRSGRTVLVAVNLNAPGVTVEPVEWVAHGLAAVVSGPISFASVPATPVGPPGWYLQRPGFWWGGIGVAACWYGGSVGVARTAWQQVHRRPGGVANVQLARIDLALHGMRIALADAAAAVDDPRTPSAEFALLAQRVRAVVADGAEVVLREAGHLLGPGPLAFDTEHARRVADLTLYIRQHHADRDLAALGSGLAGGSAAPW